MEKHPLFSLPYPSTSIVCGPTLVYDERGLLVSLVCDDDECEKSLIVHFGKPRAFRKRAEIYCQSWHIDAYDIVCEILGSDWVAELRAEADPEWRDYWVMRHFIVYLDGFGCLEVVAESVTLGENGAKNSGGT